MIKESKERKDQRIKGLIKLKDQKLTEEKPEDERTKERRTKRLKY